MLQIQMRILRVFGLSKAEMNSIIENAQAEGSPSLRLQERDGEYLVCVQASAPTQAMADEYCEKWVQKLRTRFGDACYGFEDTTLAQAALDALLKKLDELLSDRVHTIRVLLPYDKLGLAAPTGVEVAEARGRLTWSSDGNYQAGLTLMAAIGQGNTAVTPLQLAAYAATLANYGQRPALHYADRAVSAATGETLWQYTPTFTAVQGGEAVFGPIRDGMKRMAQTTRVLREAPVVCAAKTGSPQLADTLPGGSHYVNSVLIGYAPADDPQIAVAVVLEYGGGGANAAPILRAVLDAVFWI